MEVKFNDLNKQFKQISNNFYKRLDKLTQTSQYILGEDVSIFEQNFKEYIGSKYCIGVNSGTDALTLSAKTLLIPNTLFIIQANTFIATIYGIINAIQDNKSKITLIDCDEYGQISKTQLSKCIEKNQNKYNRIVVVPVHMYGGCADAQFLLDLQKSCQFYILEDSAQAHGTITNLKLKTGNIGNIAAFSFYPGKNLGALGDAGAITTNDKELYDKILKMRNIGSQQKYHHTYPAFNSRLDTIQAIVLDEKLKYLDEWNKKRNIVAQKYYNTINYGFPYSQPDYCIYHTYHLFIANSLNKKSLKDQNIEYGQHYPIPTFSIINQNKNIQKYIIKDDSKLINTDYISKNTITLPIHPYMEEQEIEYVCDAIRN